MKIGCGTVLFRKFELERALAAIREVGFEYFETQAVGPWCPHVNVETDDPETLVRLKNKYGFKEITGLWSLNGNIIRNPNAVESGIRSIEWAAAAGIPIVHTGDGAKPKDVDMSDEDAYKILGERLAILTEAARKNGVKLAIEPHGIFSLTGKGLKRIMEIDSSDALGINYDACNIFRASYVESGNNKSGWVCADGKEDELAVLHQIGDRVIHCHAKDMIGKDCVAVGTGVVNVKGCVEYLKSIGYQGVVSVETEGGDDFDAICRLAKDSYDYLCTLIAK